MANDNAVILFMCSMLQRLFNNGSTINPKSLIGKCDHLVVVIRLLQALCDHNKWCLSVVHFLQLDKHHIFV